ncbi:MAG: hypothetical protein BM556_17395 [Bacteriovorax sp. MedPE-SWde]|nr:MAG: hypothetical protein BM556_17395 [Bacteriovorax sp. MedPE-SWde]
MKLLSTILLLMFTASSFAGDITCTDAMEQYNVVVTESGDFELSTPKGIAKGEVIRSGSYLSGKNSVGGAVKSFTLDVDSGDMRVFFPRPKSFKVECSGVK